MRFASSMMPKDYRSPPVLSAAATPRRWDADALRAAAGRCFPLSTRAYLAHRTGLPPRTVEKHLSGASAPGADALLAYLNDPDIGPEMRAALLE